MDARRALLNAVAWFMGRHNRGFHLADIDVAVWVVRVVAGVLVGRGMVASLANRLRRESLEEGSDRVCLRHYPSKGLG